MIPVARIVTEDKVLWKKAVFVEDIQDLPSAQSEDRCSECDAWNQYIHYPRTQQWIPCSERLPSENESFYVLCCDKYGEIMIGHVFVCNDGETSYSAENEHEYMYDCVAWMPLPKPWEGEQDA